MDDAVVRLGVRRCWWGGVITGGISFAQKSENLLNVRVGTINQTAETFTNASSYVSLGFTVTVGVWDVARDKMDGVQTSEVRGQHTQV